MEENRNEGFSVDVMEILRRLLARWYLIVICAVIGASAAYFWTDNMITPMYEAKVDMIVNSKQNEDGTNQAELLSSGTSATLISTYAVIIRSDNVLEQVIERSGEDMSYGSLVNRVSVSPVNETQVMRITVRDSDPERAGRLVQALVEVAPDIVAETGDAGSCRLVSKVSINYNSVSPDYTRNVEIGTAIGSVLMIAIIALSAVLDNTMKSEDDVTHYLGLSVLGVIPEVKE